MKPRSLAETERYVATPSQNAFLGACTSIGYFLTEEEKESERLTDKSIFILVKTRLPLLPCVGNQTVLITEDSFQFPYRVPLRVMSSCITGLLGDSSCDCHGDMVRYLNEIKEAGEGVFVYLPQEGMGRGLRMKLNDHQLQQGITASGEQVAPRTLEDALRTLIPDEEFDVRSYGVLKECFSDLGLSRLSFKWLGSRKRGLLFETQTGLRIQDI